MVTKLSSKRITPNADEVDGQSLSTREALLRTAERLFARHGIEGVSLREINRHANQKNASAIHYHFGSREAIIEGIFEMRAARLDTRRRQLLEALTADSRPISIRLLVAALIRPQLEILLAEGSGYHYNRFLAQATLSGNPELRELWLKHFGAALIKFEAILQARIKHVPPALFRQRYAIVVDFVIYSLASMERLVGERSATEQPFPLNRAIEQLIDMVSAAIDVPISSDTAEALAKEKHLRRAGTKPSNSKRRIR